MQLRHPLHLALNLRQLQSQSLTKMCCIRMTSQIRATGWAAAEFGNYFIGYHEPESYHVEIKTPNLKAPVVGIPEA